MAIYQNSVRKYDTKPKKKKKINWPIGQTSHTDKYSQEQELQLIQTNEVVYEIKCKGKLTKISRSYI